MKRKIALLLTLVMCLSILPTVTLAAGAEAKGTAAKLYKLCLFNGTGIDENGEPDFDLDRTPTRVEAVTMLVRLLGKEEEATAGTWTTPFTDVADWAKPYVGYAYENGLTQGTSDTTFGSDDLINVSQYLSFVLGALGYKSGVDFQWDRAWELSDQIGLTNGRYTVYTKKFDRGDMAIASEYVLDYLQKRFDAERYHPILDFYDIPAGLGLPQYNAGEIQKMIDDKLTLDEVAEKITTVADFVQYLKIKEFSSASGDLHFYYKGDEWSLNRSARVVFAENKGNCGGSSNLANYILRGDYDEQGYVIEGGNSSGHVYNYFLQDGIYFFIDFTEIVDGGQYARQDCMIYQAEDPQEFSDWYIFERENKDRSKNAPHYLIHQCMYARDGNHVPIMWNKEAKTVLGKACNNVLSSEVEDSTILLYAAEPKFEVSFKDPPPISEYPEDAK